MFSMVATTAYGSNFHCVIIDPTVKGLEFRLDQVKGSDKAQYVGKSATLDFNFAKTPVAVTAVSASGKPLSFEWADGNEKKFSGFIKDAEIEIHCKQKVAKSK
jgi:hypothetical protein